MRVPYPSATDVLQVAGNFLRETSSEPTLVLVNLMEPHQPYAAAPLLGGSLASAELGFPFGPPTIFDCEEKMSLLRGLYAEEVKWLDHQLGEALRRWEREAWFQEA